MQPVKEISALRLLWISSTVECGTDTYKALVEIDSTLLCYLSTKMFDQRSQRFAGEHFLLIVDSTSAREIVPTIHDNPQIDSIYVYDTTDEANLRWTHGYPKVSFENEIV